MPACLLAVEASCGEVVALAAEDVLADAHAGGAGQVVADLEVAGHLEVGEAGGAPVDYLFGVDGGIGACGDVGLHVVLAQFRGDGDDGAVEDGGVGLDGVLHLLGGDVLTTTPYHVLLAVHEIEEAVVIQASHVAGVEPAVAAEPRGSAPRCASSRG